MREQDKQTEGKKKQTPGDSCQDDIPKFDVKPFSLILVTRVAQMIADKTV